MMHAAAVNLLVLRICWYERPPYFTQHVIRVNKLGVSSQGSDQIHLSLGVDRGPICMFYVVKIPWYQ